MYNTVCVQFQAMETAKSSKDRNQSTSNKSLFRDARPKGSSMGHGSRPGDDHVGSKDITVPTENQRVSENAFEFRCTQGSDCRSNPGCDSCSVGLALI